MLFRKSYESLSKWSTLLIRTAVFAVLVVGVIWIVRYCKNRSENENWKLEQTGIKIESIKEISELCTVTFRDEVIVDTVEHYRTIQERINGNIYKLSDPDNWKYSASDEKRRLTMIVGGEVRYGFNLKDGEFKLKLIGDSTIISVSSPKVLDVITLPSKTSVFKEHGDWSDNTRTILQKRAMKKISDYAKTLNLDEKAKKQLEDLLKKMVGNPDKLVITYL